MKKLTEKLITKTQNQVVLMLLASRDCYKNQKRNVANFDCTDGYYGEAFGILRGLELCGYGYFGANNLPAEIDNLKWWFDRLGDLALQEEKELGLSMALDKYRELSVKH